MAWKGAKTANTLENLYYGNIDPHEQTVSNRADKGELFKTVVRLETELRATLTEIQTSCKFFAFQALDHLVFCHEKQRAKLHNNLKGVGADMIAAIQKEDIKEETSGL